VGLLKPKTVQELAEEYGISRETFRRWIEPFICEIGTRKGNIFNIKQVSIIYDKLGTP
jgi:transposase-like protein